MTHRSLLLSIVFTAASFAQNTLAQNTSAILPQSFSGWQKGAAKHVNDPLAIDASNAAALKEYGFKDSEQATYTRDGRQITLKAIRFADGTGGFGGFTYYREPGMVREKLCDGAASAREHILFYCADILVDAKWDRITAMTMADLRTLAEVLPKITGQSAQAPNVPPSIRESEDLKLALGPAAYNHFLALPGWSELIPPVSNVDFTRSAEVMFAPVSQGRGIVTVIRYPTPHIAIQEQPRLQGWASQAPADAGERNINSLVKRSGPILSAVRGQLGTDETKSVLDAINYEADVTWNESTGLEKRNNIGGLVYAAILLAIIIFGFAVIGGVFFGGFRYLMRKFFPGRFIDRPENVEFIKLNIDQAPTLGDRK
jgi:hypothetical protein